MDPNGLQDNGGPTETIALQPTSPAIDAIPSGASGCGFAVTEDQRGEGRPQGPACDVGAFEATPDETPPTLDTDNSDGTDGITPDNEATGVSRDVQPTATFSDEMESDSLKTSAELYQWNAKKGWQPVPVAVSVEGKTATLDPNPDKPTRLLGAKKKYKVTVTTGAKNLVGLPLESTKSWTFTTGVS